MFIRVNLTHVLEFVGEMDLLLPKKLLFDG